MKISGINSLLKTGQVNNLGSGCIWRQGIDLAVGTLGTLVDAVFEQYGARKRSTDFRCGEGLGSETLFFTQSATGSWPDNRFLNMVTRKTLSKSHLDRIQYFL